MICVEASGAVLPVDRLKILMMISDLPIGGAEIFFVRLAKALSKKHEVHVSLGQRTTTNPELLAQLHGIPVSSPPLTGPILYRYLYKVSQMVSGPHRMVSLVDQVRSLALRLLHRRHRFDVVNPHLLEAERQACLAFEKSEVPIVSSDHGDYHWVLDEEAQLRRFQPVLTRANALVCPSSANIRSAQKFSRPEGFRYFKIFYGLDDAYAPTTSSDNSAFRFVMVARGQKEKGWSEAISAFRQLREDLPSKNLELHLVGDGPHLNSLKVSSEISKIKGLVFHGHSNDPRPIVAMSDVGLLPTYLPSESLPNAIIEYLASGKPVIATPVGGIEEMLASEEGTAGVIVPRSPDGTADVLELAAAMKELATNESALHHLQERTRAAFEKFSMEACCERYEAAFRSLTGNHSRRHAADARLE